MKLALGQIDCEPGAVTKNVEMLVAKTKQAAEAGCSVVAFPEMSDVGYDMPKIVEHATKWSQGSFVELAAAAKDNHINLVVGLAERVDDDVDDEVADGNKTHIYNTIAVIGADGVLIAKYRKVHLITAEPILEQNYITAGTSLTLCDVDGFRCGIMTCYDIRFPELARSLTTQGAELIFAPSAFPLSRIEHWRVITTCRAIENQVYVVAPNRVGSEGGVTFGGDSRVVDPYGMSIAEMTEVDTGLVTAEITKARIDEVRNGVKALSDRREDLYQAWNDG